MREQTITRSPVGPFAWEFRHGVSEVRSSVFTGYDVQSPNLPELRYMPSLPVPLNAAYYRLARYGWSRTVPNGETFI